MFEPKSKMINGMTFKVVPFPAVEALRLKIHLVKIFGPALGQALGGVSSLSSIEEAQINGEAIGKALQMLTSELSETEFIDLLRRMLKNTHCETKVEGKKIWADLENDFDTKMDMIFQGQLLTVYPLMLFVLEVNFPDFFAQAGGIFSRLQTVASKKGKGKEKVLNETSETSES